MPDPLSQIITLMRPRAVFSKEISGAGRWGVRYPEFGQPSFCAVTQGSCRLAVEGAEPVLLQAGDFVLLPATPAFTLTGPEPAIPRRADPQAPLPPGGLRHGRQDGPAETAMVGGHFSFGAPDARLLVSLLPAMIHLRGVGRLAALVQMMGEETATGADGADLVLERLVEILLVQALRAVPGRTVAPGLLRGLADPRIAPALRALHAESARDWGVAELAGIAGLSRSAFFDRFCRTVGLPPMEYLLSWRMALAKDLLRQGGLALDQVAGRVGYGSAASFSAAFSRHVGQAPGRFARSSAVA